MAHIGTLRDFKFKGDVDDIRGASLYGRGNEKLGKVDDVVFDHAGGYIQYLVVDTGGWLKSNKFLVPADRVNAHTGDDDFTCDLTKEQIERFPEYKDSIIRNQSDWDNYEKRYRGTLDDSGDVLHRPGSDHLVTPDASELPAISDDVRAGVDFTPQRLVNKFETAEPTSAKLRLRPQGTAARAEDSKNPGSALRSEDAVWSKEDSPVRNRRATDRVREEDDSTVESAYGDPELQEVPVVISDNDPPAYRAGEELNSHVGERYMTNRRLRDFEDSLRRNRVDITASCRACDVDKEEAA